MKKYLLSISLLGLAACAQPEPLCDRENIEWDKYGTAEGCEIGNVPVAFAGYKSDSRTRDSGVEPADSHRVRTVEPTHVRTHSGPPDDHVKPKPKHKVKKNNGLGNGDQPAPGRSLNHNRAENQRGAPGHASGKAQRPN